jgi:hypothetical protein
MSVKMFQKDEVYSELRKAGFEPTDEITEHNTIWKGEKGEISVNHSHEVFPYYYLSDLLSLYGLECNSSGTIIDIKTYKVSH